MKPIVVILCMLLATAGCSCGPGTPGETRSADVFGGVWYSELRATYKVEGGTMTCIAIPPGIEKTHSRWIGKVRLKDIAPSGDAGVFSAKQASRDPKSGDLVSWLDAKVVVEDERMVVSFSDKTVGRRFSYTFSRHKQASDGGQQAGGADS